MNNNFKKAILLTAVSVIFSAATFGQTSSASSLKAYATDDFTALVPVGYFTSSANQALLDNQMIGQDLFVSFIKFDISGLKDKTFGSAKINLFGSGNIGGSASLYYVANDAWVNQSTDKGPINLSSLQGIKLASSDTSNTASMHEFMFDDLSALISNLNDPSDNYFSVVLKADKSFDNALFYSRESNTPPSLELIPPVAPAPEPASMVLGLMSLGSMLGFRRKKTVA